MRVPYSLRKSDSDNIPKMQIPVEQISEPGGLRLDAGAGVTSRANSLSPSKQGTSMGSSDSGFGEMSQSRHIKVYLRNAPGDHGRYTTDDRIFSAERANHQDSSTIAPDIDLLVSYPGVVSFETISNALLKKLFGGIPVEQVACQDDTFRVDVVKTQPVMKSLEAVLHKMHSTRDIDVDPCDLSSPSSNTILDSISPSSAEAEPCIAVAEEFPSETPKLDNFANELFNGSSQLFEEFVAFLASTLDENSGTELNDANPAQIDESSSLGDCSISSSEESSVVLLDPDIDDSFEVEEVQELLEVSVVLTRMKLYAPVIDLTSSISGNDSISGNESDSDYGYTESDEDVLELDINNNLKRTNGSRRITRSRGKRLKSLYYCDRPSPPRSDSDSSTDSGNDDLFQEIRQRPRKILKKRNLRPTVGILYGYSRKRR